MENKKSNVFEDKEFEKLVKIKDGMTWKEYIMREVK